MVLMNTITFLVTVYNKERYIAKVIESLKAISGAFRKEFVIIDDGSTDASLEIIKQHTASLKNVLIITQKNQGPAIALNKGISLSSGDYVFFVDGDDIIEENGPSLLLKACKDLGVDVAFGARGKYDPETEEKFGSKKLLTLLARHEAIQKNAPLRCTKDFFAWRRHCETIWQTKQSITSKNNNEEEDRATLITSPLSALLEGKISRIRSIGSSGSLVKLDLLKKIGGCDEGIFVQNFSLSLRCAQYSNFAYMPYITSFEPITYDKQNLSSNKNYEYYNTLKALSNFIASNPEIVEEFKIQFHRAFWSTMKRIYRYNLKTFYQYILSKYTNTKLAIADLLALYQDNIRKLL